LQRCLQRAASKALPRISSKLGSVASESLSVVN
jgi:hypothetical protein